MGLVTLRVGMIVALVAGLVTPSAQVPARASLADSKPDRTSVTNGPVEAVVRAGDTVYIGGRFNRVGPRTGPGLEFALDGSQNAGLPEVTGGGGLVDAVVSDGSGGWYIGGLFTHVGGAARNNIAHINADRSVDAAFNPDANGRVHALALSGATLYAGGLFTSIGGQPRNRIAAVNASDGIANAFNPNADAAVEALAVSSSGSIIYAGGRFTTIGGQPRLSLAALDAAVGLATPTFNPSPIKTDLPSPGPVRALALSGSTLYVGGSFGMIGGQPRNNIAALHLGGLQDGLATSFNPDARRGTCSACGGVDALAVSGSTVYAGGLFTSIGGATRRHLAGLDAISGTATAFNPDPNAGSIFGLAVSADGSTVYAAGGFNSSDGLPSIGGQARNYLAALNAADGTATAFNPNPNAVALAVGVSGSAVYVGGAFSSIGGVVRNGIAAINATDGTATSFDPNARFGANNATVYALAVSGSTVYAGGFFNSIGGQPRNYIAALNAADGTATGWNPGANSIVQALAVSGSILYAGGWFTSIGGQPRNYIAALNLSDGLPTAFNPSANSGVEAIAVADSLVYAGGFFTSIGGHTRNKIAALNVADGSATDWNPDATAQANVLAIAVSDSTIYAGGNFVTIGGQARKNIAALNASDGMATSFDPQASDGGVYALALSGSTVYAGGFFSTIGGRTRHLLAGLNVGDGTATSFDPGGSPGFGVKALTMAPDGTLYVGGSFSGFELAFQQGFASFAGLPATRPTLATEIAFSGDSATSGQYTDPTRFAAHLVDSDEDPIEGATLTFTLSGAESSREFTATTAQNGLASVTPTLEERPGPYQLMVRFAGDEHHAGDTDAVSFVVEKEDSALELSVHGEDDDKTLRARLSDLDSPSDGIADRTIDFYSDSELIGSGQTDSDGVASVPVPPRHRGANRTYEAVFEGDDFYLRSSDQRAGKGGMGGDGNSAEEESARRYLKGGVFLL